MKNVNKDDASLWMKVLSLSICMLFSLFLTARVAAQEQQNPETQSQPEYQQEEQTETQQEGQTETQPQPEYQQEGEPETQPQPEYQEENQTESETQTDPQQDPAMDPQMGQQQTLTSDDLSDEELMAFVESANEVMEIHEEAEEKMIQTIEESELDIETFNKILQARQAEQVPEADPEQVEAFQKVFPEVLNEQQKVNAKIEASLQEKGLDIATYENIMIAYQQDPQVQQRVNELIQKNGTK